MNRNKNSFMAKKTSYNVYDAGFNFGAVLIAPIFAAIVITIIFATLATATGMNYADFSALKWSKILSQASVHLSFLLVFLIYNKKINASVPLACQIKRKIDFRRVLVLVIISVSLILLVAPLVGVLDEVYKLFKYNPSNDLTFEIKTIGDLIIGGILFAAIPAVVEELLFRGVILNGLRAKFTDTNAVLISSVMFVLMHGALQQTFYQFVLGLVLGLVMILTKNLWYAIIFHFINNFIVVALQYYISQGNGTAAESSVLLDFPTILTACIMFAFAIIVVFVLLLLLSDKPKENIKSFIKNKKINFNAISSQVDNIILINDNPKEGTKALPTIVIDNEIEKGGVDKLTKQEQFVLFTGLVIAAILWLVNTLSVIV